MPGKGERAQALAETAIVLPMLFLLVLGTLQCVMLAYGSAAARFSAFCALRASATAPPLSRQATAQSSVHRLLEGMPAVTPLSVTLKETPLPLRGAGMPASRMTCTVTARVPRILPVRVMRMALVRASCALPMEPSR